LSGLVLIAACSLTPKGENDALRNRISADNIKHANQHILPNGDSGKIMWLGDSILAGRGANSRYLLWNKLLDAGYSKIDFVGNNQEQSYEGDFDKDNETYGGRKANEVRDLATPAIAQYKPDFAFIHLGTNDRWENPPDKAANTAQEIGQIIDRLQQSNPSVKVFVFKFVHLDSNWQRDLAAAIEAMVAQKKTDQSPVKALDLIRVWNAATDTYDGTHANLNGQIKIADMLFDAVVPYLGTPGPVKVRTAIMEPPNISLNKTVTASEQWDGVFPAQKKDNFGPKGPDAKFAVAANATDGNLFTSWIASDPKGGHWLMVDLGQSRNLTGSATYWDSAGEKYSYTIEVSDDMNNWKTVVDKTKEPSLAKALIGDRDKFTATGRYVRVNNMNPNNPWWSDIKIGIREFRVFDTDSATVTANPKWAWDY
jgi:lysophospholipase L1-like esterase